MDFQFYSLTFAAFHHYARMGAVAPAAVIDQLVAVATEENQ